MLGVNTDIVLRALRVLRDEGRVRVPRGRGISARALLEALPASVYLTDSAGRLTFYNQAAVDLWGWQPEIETETNRPNRIEQPIASRL